jgi:hypothetical protein
VFTNKAQINVFDISSFMLLVLMSKYEGDNSNLPAYFAKALQAAG